MTDRNPYRISDHGFYVIHFSGGKTSGYMLAHILDAHGGNLPQNAEVVFTNTGKEVEQTYEFIRDFERETGCPITWLEYWYDKQAKGGRGNPKHKHKQVSFETAARNGEPFIDLVDVRKYLPNVVSRICTATLKVETCEYYVKRELGIKEWIDIIGFRYDEPKRWWKETMQTEETGRNGKCINKDRKLPLVEAGVTKQDVEKYWQDFSWRLRMDSNFGNCDLCFLKGKKKLVHIIRKNPSAADWWIERERERDQ